MWSDRTCLSRYMMYVNKYADGRCHWKNIARQSRHSHSSIEQYSKCYPHWHIYVTHALRWLRQKRSLPILRTGGFTSTSSLSNCAQFHKMSHIYLHILLAFLFLKSCRVNMLLLCALVAFLQRYNRNKTRPRNQHEKPKCLSEVPCGVNSYQTGLATLQCD